MKMTIVRVPEMTIEEFAEMHDLEMEVRERGRGLRDLPRFYAHFRGAEVMVPVGFLQSATGNGETVEAAIRGYAHEISERRLVIDAMRSTRREFDVPRLIEKEVT